MKKLNLNLGEKSYPIYIGENLLAQADSHQCISGDDCF